MKLCKVFFIQKIFRIKLKLDLLLSLPSDEMQLHLLPLHFHSSIHFLLSFLPICSFHASQPLSLTSPSFNELHHLFLRRAFGGSGAPSDLGRGSPITMESPSVGWSGECDDRVLGLDLGGFSEKSPGVANSGGTVFSPGVTSVLFTLDVASGDPGGVNSSDLITKSCFSRQSEPLLLLETGESCSDFILFLTDSCPGAAFLHEDG